MTSSADLTHRYYSPINGSETELRTRLVVSEFFTGWPVYLGNREWLKLSSLLTPNARFATKEYRGNYVPQVINTWSGLRVVAPDTPYVAAAGANQLYFIDTRFDPETAQHIKEHIERATVPGEPDEVIWIDEISATAEVRNTLTNETVFVFDPPYARVLFAAGINRLNPKLKLPEHEPAGDWLVTYDIGTSLTRRQPRDCSSYGCYHPEDCRRQSHDQCDVCHRSRVDNWCSRAMTNAVGVCRPLCNKAVDTPKEHGETDASYYQRMEKLHWK
ncbi:hypothetical protein B0J13DRAFT_621914 [Dactylonectria estremocensis]|uniref:Uncharacterized protein n=1 Tax=Dactylonectria estremocensis TaxID=1079267 RepID=A0A9P9J9A7_9HYPO|nr:hypothetical protein B0J13DRAFT_621914 [Dactylonectria estremocensis]